MLSNGNLWWIVLCATLAHGASGQDSPAPPPAAAQAGCVSGDCHGSVLGRSFMHAPTAQQKCVACHVCTDAAKHEFQLAAAPDQLCVTCHSIKKFDFTHEPVKDGHCTGCHDPHGSEFRSLLKADPLGDLCRSCHGANAYSERRFVHEPVASQACILCHEAHGSWRPHLLASDTRSLCLSCHSAVAEGVASARHVHAPLLDTPCTRCHDPHASDHVAQLREDPQRLCLSCHTTTADQLSSSTTVHAAVAQEQACLNCHAGHDAAFPALLERQPIDLCLQCHSQPLADAKGKTLPNMATLLADNPFHHGPIREGDCTACHDAHASSHFRLLEQDYPPEFYAPFALDRYALCFSCHVREMVLQPYGVGITGFAQTTPDGLLNLHYVHVHKEKKGRTCRACHEVHASQRPFHIRESVPFGDEGWSLEINFTQTSTGGKCAPACHDPQSYVRPGGSSLQNATEDPP